MENLTNTLLDSTGVLNEHKVTKIDNQNSLDQLPLKKIIYSAQELIAIRDFGNNAKDEIFLIESIPLNLKAQPERAFQNPLEFVYGLQDFRPRISLKKMQLRQKMQRVGDTSPAGTVRTSRVKATNSDNLMDNQHTQELIAIRDLENNAKDEKLLTDSIPKAQIKTISQKNSEPEFQYKAESSSLPDDLGMLLNPSKVNVNGSLPLNTVRAIVDEFNLREVEEGKNTNPLKKTVEKQVQNINETDDLLGAVGFDKIVLPKMDDKIDDKIAEFKKSVSNLMNQSMEITQSLPNLQSITGNEIKCNKESSAPHQTDPIETVTLREDLMQKTRDIQEKLKRLTGSTQKK